MSRLLLGLLVAIAAWPVAATAQVPVTTASGVGSFGGGVRPATPALMAPIGRPHFRPWFRPPLGPGYFIGGPGFYGGGFITGYPGNLYYGGGYYGYYSYYGAPYFVTGPQYYSGYANPEPPPIQAVETIPLGNEFPAALTLAFPAAARVWLDGKAVEGEPAAEQTLTSPVLRPGEKYTFNVRARWAVNGQEYEYTRDVTLGSGEKSRVLVVTGTPVK